jgi:hypothetical protein
VRFEWEAEGAASLSGRRKELVLLTYLVRRAPRPLALGEAATLLWQDLVGDGLRVGAEHLGLAEGAVEVDATLFEQELDAGQLPTAVARWRLRGKVFRQLDAAYNAAKLFFPMIDDPPPPSAGRSR